MPQPRLRVVPGEQRGRARGDGTQEPLLVVAELPGGARGDAQHSEQFVTELQGKGEHGARVLRVRCFDDAAIRQRAAGNAARIGGVRRDFQAGGRADHELAVLADEQGRGIGGQRALHRQVGQVPRRSVGKRSFQSVEDALGRRERVQHRGLRPVDLPAEAARLGRCQRSVLAELEDGIAQCGALARRFRRLHASARFGDQPRDALRSEVTSAAAKEPGKLPGRTCLAPHRRELTHRCRVEAERLAPGAAHQASRQAGTAVLVVC